LFLRGARQFFPQQALALEHAVDVRIAMLPANVPGEEGKVHGNLLSRRFPARYGGGPTEQRRCSTDVPARRNRSPTSSSRPDCPQVSMSASPDGECSPS